MSGMLALAVLVFVVGLLPLAAFERWLLLRTEGVAVSHSIAEQVVVPLGRCALLILFLLLGYPALYGLRESPPLATILFATDGRINDLLNLLFLFGLVLPLIPLLNRLPALTLPLHAIAGATLLFSWLARSLGQSVSLIPEGRTLLLFLVVASLGHWLGKLLRHLTDDEVTATVLYGIALMACQVPSVLLYTLGLGSRLAR